MSHSKLIKLDAINLYYELGGNYKEVERRLGVPDSTVQRWIKQHEQAEPVVERRLNTSFMCLETKLQNGYVLVISDQHQNPRIGNSVAANGALEVAKIIKPSAVYHLGDLLDFASISTHDKLGWTDSYTVQEELDSGMDYLREMSAVTRGADRIMLQGNHDQRFNKFLSKHAPQFKGIGGFDIVDHIPSDWRYALSILLNGNTKFLHAHHGGVHAAYNNVLKGGINIVTGHTHILECKPFSDYSGTRFGIQTGTLSTIKDNPFFDYTFHTPLNWQAGFVVLRYIDGKLQYPEIAFVNQNNQCIFRGEIVYE